VRDSLFLSFLRFASLTGFLLFAAVFAVVALAPRYVERSARDFIAYKLSSEIEELLPGSTQNGKAPSEWRLSAETLDELKQVQDQLQDRFHAAVEKFFAGLCQFDCGRFEALRELALNVFHMLSAQAFDNLRSIAQDRYSDVLAKIRRELLIFSGINMFVFGLAFLATDLKRGWTGVLRIPLCIWLTAACVSIWLYLFQSNWFFTILFDSYLGFGYLAFLLLMFGLIAHWSYRARQLLQ
jgi:hypothetical protein